MSGGKKASPPKSKTPVPLKKGNATMKKKAGLSNSGNNPNPGRNTRPVA
jgi:hypothetical protein